MKNASKWDKALLSTAGALLLTGSIALSLFPAPRFSASENRFLAEMPTLTAEALFGGAYTAALERYATERMPARSKMRALGALLDIGMGYGEVRGVIPCSGGVLLRRPKVSQSHYAQNLRTLQALCTTCEQESGTPPIVVVLPRSIDVAQALLPADFDRKDLLTVWKTLHQALPDALTPQACAKPEYWYRTDHHWTSDGAYTAYLALGEVLDFRPSTDFERIVVSTDFHGSTAAAGGIPFVRADEICLYRYAGDTALRVRKNRQDVDFLGLYDERSLATHDQYSVFLGGNCALLEIDLGEDDERPLLWMLKDSFANSLIPFLARHFRIVAFDPRYAPSAAQMREVIQKADAHLMLCGIQSLCEGRFF